MTVQYSPERLRVWTALSELYLDTKITDSDIRRISDVLRQSPYSRDELHVILRDEVAPAFSSNLLSIAGEWAPWSEDEVQAIVQRWLRKISGGFVIKLATYLYPKIIPKEWKRIADMLA